MTFNYFVIYLGASLFSRARLHQSMDPNRLGNQRRRNRLILSLHAILHTASRKKTATAPVGRCLQAIQYARQFYPWLYHHALVANAGPIIGGSFEVKSR